ncbi:DNA binding protein [Halogeometricum borinquense DSM 11551]|uniref:DNA binding protein n=1 Tax=Halogeometricum borinquense (strain ATCC 700274 / DSM 11551 / JCM 10706 / KCTC 4070 / PR3) TaxID=469382 RepID=E4NS78_HALBP|nr:helix-turn-helix domain-containing protein [Halogeometricum borinquense]ADQ65763.1 predicted DNA binding protein [Halogeometricum borinquense DSM 11551]ELY26767.1 DNA binding protein [Halogeometricum borinquense DSM 11551]
MPHLKIKLNGEKIGGWLAELSTEFPADVFRLLATQLRDQGALVTLEVRTPDGGDVIQEFETTPEVGNVEVLHADSQVVLLQFLTKHSRAYDPLYESGCISIYPTTLQNGWFSVHVVAGHDSLSSYVEELTAAEIPYQVLSLSQSHDTATILTNRQRQFIETALEEGFYDDPRACTLTELAATLDIHKSAASRLRHRAESRLITHVATGFAQ